MTRGTAESRNLPIPRTNGRTVALQRPLYRSRSRWRVEEADERRCELVGGFLDHVMPLVMATPRRSLAQGRHTASTSPYSCSMSSPLDQATKVGVESTDVVYDDLDGVRVVRT